MQRRLTSGELVDEQGAHPNYVLLVRMGNAMHARLLREHSIDTEVPIDAKERKNASLPVPLRGAIKAIRNTGKNLPHYVVDPSAASRSG